MRLETQPFCRSQQTDPGIFAACENYQDGATHSPVRYHQWSLGLTLKGRCRFCNEGNEFVVQAGDLTLVHPDAQAGWEVEGDEPWSVVYAVFYARPQWHEWLFAPELESCLVRLGSDGANFARVRHGLLAVHRMYSRSVLHRDAWAALALERVLLTLHTLLTVEKTALDVRVNHAVRFIHDHYPRALTNSDIAIAAHSSVSHLAALFTQQVGMAPMKYLENLRLQRAAEMLQFTNASVKDILTANGYSDAAYFSNRFRKYSGHSPRAFRKRREA